MVLLYNIIFLTLGFGSPLREPGIAAMTQWRLRKYISISLAAPQPSIAVGQVIRETGVIVLKPDLS